MSYQVKVPLRSLPNLSFCSVTKDICFSFQLTKPCVTKKIELKETKQNKQTTTKTKTKIITQNKTKTKQNGGQLLIVYLKSEGVDSEASNQQKSKSFIFMDTCRCK